MLNVTKNIEDGKAVLSLEGRLDALTAPELENELKDILDGLKELTLDFEKLSYVSSAGLRVLLSTQEVMERQGVMKIRHVSDVLMEIFELTGFDNMLIFE